MASRVSENFLKSNAKMRTFAKSRETKNRLAVGELKRKHCQALNKIKKLRQEVAALREQSLAEREWKAVCMDEPEAHPSEFMVFGKRKGTWAHFFDGQR